jgi:ParB-like chromosome segregation protein Spo0J
MAHARALLGLEDDAERQRLAQLIAERGLSVRETEHVVGKAMKWEGGAFHQRPPMSDTWLRMVVSAREEASRTR